MRGREGDSPSWKIEADVMVVCLYILYIPSDVMLLGW